MYKHILYPVVGMLFGLILPAPAASAQSAVESPSAATLAEGKELYVNNCSACHLPDGKGIPNLAPALSGNPLLARDPALLIQIVLKGPAAVLPADRPRYGSSTMDSFYYKLDDDQVAAILTYIRHDFVKGDKSPPIAPKDVAAVRAKIDVKTLNN
jgi:mono/diheme cytochrome c family protein